MGLKHEHILATLQTCHESATLNEMESQLFVYDDVIGHLINHPDGKTVNPQETFSFLIHFAQTHPMLQGKTQEEQEHLIKQVAAGNLSLRSNMAITGITHTQREPAIRWQGDDKTWEVEMELANDSPRQVFVPQEFQVGRPFVRPEKALGGKDLILAAAHLCMEESDHVSFLTKNGNLASFGTLIADVATLDPESPDYPIAVFLPYTDDVGVIRKGDQPLALHTMSNRRNGFVEENVDWHGSIGADRRRNPAVILKRTRGDIAMPDGFVGVIREQGIPGQVPHSRSTVLSAGYSWPIIGEHPLRTAGNNLMNPTGFIMDMYKTA